MTVNIVRQADRLKPTGCERVTLRRAAQASLAWPVLLCWVLLSPSARAETFEFKVKHEHIRGSCRGKLIIDDSQIQYVAENGKHSWRWDYVDIQKLDVSPKKIELLSFQSRSKWKLGSDKVYEFKLLEGELAYGQQEFLRSKLSRPVVARLVDSSSPALQKLPARHRHTLGGCEGILILNQDRITYSTDYSRHNREWRYSDLETIGSPDPYRLRITSNNETFTFDLKTPLEQKVYDFLWDKVNGLARPVSTPEMK